MKQYIFMLVVLGLGLGGCATPREVLAGKPAFKGIELKARNEPRPVEGVIAEYQHTWAKEECTERFVAEGLCWGTSKDVEKKHGKYSRSGYYDSQDQYGDTIRRWVYYYDSPESTEVFIFGQSDRLIDDFVVNKAGFVIDHDRENLIERQVYRKKMY
ncbi:MAG: hypothetical protein PHF20_01445 [Halothiobacillaceae bacterium]|nr:hypothetical protein [Halothiobacillaceae bacterium]